MMRILFFGESWNGSFARSLREAITRQPGVRLTDVSEDAWQPKARGILLRGINRLLAPAYRREMFAEVLRTVDAFRPHVFITYKGYSLNEGFIREIKARDILAINVYPDCSPHAHGERHRQAVGSYDLVVSTKPFHPRLWKTLYDYDNACVFVPHGYDPHLHFDAGEPSAYQYDIGLIATWRAEYGEALHKLAACLRNREVTVGIGGNGWRAHRARYPDNWTFVGPVHGRGYIEWLRGARICLAPVTREVVIDGRTQPGDEDTTRTYELAAGKCFFIHRRTEYLNSIYDGGTEVPAYDTPEELAELITHFLPRESERRSLANAAHRRAVPAYSIDARAARIMGLIKERFDICQ